MWYFCKFHKGIFERIPGKISEGITGDISETSSNPWQKTFQDEPLEEFPKELLKNVWKSSTWISGKSMEAFLMQCIADIYGKM